MNPEWLFEIPPRKQDALDMTNTALQLTALAERLANENRTLVSHEDGRVENVAEHSNMLGVVAPAIAEQYFPELDANLIARFASIHDIVEAYVGDTPTHDITHAGMLSKEELEKLGLEQLKVEFKHLPHFVELVADYEAQIIPEARFLRVVDKWMPLLLHFQNKGEVLRSYIDAESMLENSRERSAALREKYPEFEQLVRVREDLAWLAVKELFR